MKYLVALVILTLSVTAQASHHRDHAVMHIDGSLRFLGYAIGIAERERDNPETPETIAKALNKYVIYASKYQNRIKAAREVLASQGDLEEARRLISAPGTTGELESAEYGVDAIVSILAVAVREGGDDWKLSLILTRNSKAAQSLGWAHWHVIDAIREEIYQDPEFICSGAGNHCE